MDGPYIRIEDSGAVIPLSRDVTTIGRGSCVDVRLGDPSVSRLHAEIVRRGPYAYVTDLGLSHNGTRVNGRLVARRVLQDGDVLTFGSARCRVGGITAEDLSAEVELSKFAVPELTRRELDVVTALCRPALSDAAFVAPGTAREIACDLVVTEAAVKQHLLRLYQKFRIPEGPNRRVRLANEVVALGLVRPLPPTDPPGERPAGIPDQRPAGIPDQGPAGIPNARPAGIPDQGPAGIPDQGPAGIPNARPAGAAGEWLAGRAGEHASQAGQRGSAETRGTAWAARPAAAAGAAAQDGSGLRRPTALPA